jgi:dynamin GTPase
LRDPWLLWHLQPTGENGATRAPIVVDLHRDPGLSTKSIVLQIDSKSQQVSASE